MRSNTCSTTPAASRARGLNPVTRLGGSSCPRGTNLPMLSRRYYYSISRKEFSKRGGSTGWIVRSARDSGGGRRGKVGSLRSMCSEKSPAERPIHLKGRLQKKLNRSKINLQLRNSRRCRKGRAAARRSQLIVNTQTENALIPRMGSGSAEKEAGGDDDRRGIAF